MGTVTLTDTTFDEAVAAGGTLIVDVWAPWCAPCRRFAPIFEQAAQDHPDVVFAKVDADAEPELAARLRIRAIPTLLAYRDGRQVKRKIGAVPAARLERLVTELSSSAPAGDGEPGGRRGLLGLFGGGRRRDDAVPPATQG